MKWRNVAVGTRVRLAGRDYKLTSSVPKKKGRELDVTVEGGITGATTARVKADDEVEVALSEPMKKRARQREGEKARAAAAAGTWKPDPVDVEYVKKAAKKAAKKSARMKAARDVEVTVPNPSKGEAVVRGLMQAVPIATVKLKGEYVLDEPTPASIESHLYLFHHVDPGEASWPTTYADQVALHERLHAEGDAVPFHRHPGMKEPKR